jgi:hypothetical protein
MWQYQGGIMNGKENQIELKTARAVTDNPNLPYEFVREVLLASEEVKQGMVKRYVRKTTRHAVAK